MRIQHNILAMNAYRNYNTNTSALSKNLEKLSSGYKINRAGDDAAGLAISEKMRAQITGLNAAQKNVKDGISLVKTAEGAMQEIQDMLNRMDYLATQSANGTYDNEVDRANLQKEVEALKSEINRIADSANFNGINLLDGSKAAKSTSALGASAAQLLNGLDGSSPTKAGAAEITLKLANNAATASTPLEGKGVDGTVPSKATAATATLTLGAAKTVVYKSGTINGAAVNTGTDLDLSNWKAGDSITLTIDGQDKTYNFDTNVDTLRTALAADGITLTDSSAGTDESKNNITATPSSITIATGQTITAGTTTATDIADLEYDTTNHKKLSELFDIKVYQGATGTTERTGAIQAGDRVELVAKNEGSLGTTVDNAMKAITANNGGKVQYTAGVDEGAASSAEKVTKYDLEIDLSKLRGGQYLQIGTTKINFNADGTAASTTEIDLNDTANLADKVDAALDALFGTTNFKAAVSTVDGNVLKYSIEGISNAKVDDSNMGKVRLFDHDGTEVDQANSAFTKADYTPAAKAPAATTPAPGPFAKVQYEITTADLKAGNKITIGDKTLEIVAAGKADYANGKIAEDAFATDLVKALEQMGYDSGKVTMGTSGTNTTITIEGTTIGEKAADLMKGAGFVSFMDASKAPASKAEVTGGMSIEAGTTTIETIKSASMPGNKKLSDLFNITVNGNTVADSYKIQEGDEIKFTAKNDGKYDKTVMDKFNFTAESNIDSLTKKNGWDEGQGASGDKTHYELVIDMARVAGGNSFTFGNVNGKSYTFDLSYDAEGTKNDTAGADKKDDVSGNTDRTVINLYGKTTAEAQAEIFTQVQNKMKDAGFDVTRAISGNKITLTMDAKEEGAEYNMGNIRTSSASGAFSGAVYNPAGGGAGGTEGTMAQVTYKFDVSQLQAGDVLTIGGTSITIGEETKKETVDGNVKLTVSAEEAKADPNKAIVEALESAGYRSGQVKFDTDNKTVTITGIQTGETAADLQANGARMSLSNANRSMDEGGLTLQIGDTADSFNQMIVSIGDMHTTGMGIDGITIANQADASKAVDIIKNAINYVSSVRGDLGATQNRLEHTANNLSVMAENIQDAESTIRDTDIAEEMMAYTKNNILVQSAQAMLAQANAVPQGVLQLLG